ncbi:hypothetical protein PoB_007717000 [Plakobranchus ocellatus]|uniref:Uncharacterized protein n=1 Tax=Plakobranchus ocellatus TaxID=259542 RepID=A0AAV4E2Q0_9GAST|nr:hypothetical protein PoB_007717000 [Plakobranchus ocellatus]
MSVPNRAPEEEDEQKVRDQLMLIVIPGDASMDELVAQLPYLRWSFVSDRQLAFETDTYVFQLPKNGQARLSRLEDYFAFYDWIMLWIC